MSDESAPNEDAEGSHSADAPCEPKQQQAHVKVAEVAASANTHHKRQHSNQSNATTGSGDDFNAAVSVEHHDKYAPIGDGSGKLASAARPTIPPISKCVESIKNLARNRHSTGAGTRAPNFGLKEHTHVYMHAIAFLSYLKQDQDLLFQVAELKDVKNKEDPVRYKSSAIAPALTDLPAMQAVQEDGALLHALLTLLSSKVMVYLSVGGSSASSSKKQQGSSPNTTPTVPAVIVKAPSSVGPAVATPNDPKRSMNAAAVMNAAVQASQGHRKRSSSCANLHESGTDSTPMVPMNKIAKKLSGGAFVTAVGMSPKPERSTLNKKKGGGGLSGQGPAAHDAAAGGGNGVPGAWQTCFVPHAYASAVLCTALRHAKHWPAALVGAYAEDCFGSRRWVDDQRCQRLVENLQTALQEQDDALKNKATPKQQDVKPDPVQLQLLQDAEKYVTKCASLLQSGSVQLSSTNADDQHLSNKAGARPAPKRTLSGSMIGQGSMLRQRSRPPKLTGGKIEQISSHDAKPPPHDTGADYTSQAATVADDDRSAASFSEYATVECGAKPERVQRQESSSSQHDDASARSIQSSTVTGGVGTPLHHKKSSSTGSGSVPASVPSSVVATSAHKTEQGALYGLARPLDLSPVRRRYFGANLQLAHRYIIRALVERLSPQSSKKTKSQTNSKLLAALPTFMALPKVRAMTSQHLEKWLQSAALSVLAKALFSSLVKNMRHQDPPLPEDIQVIRSVLGMKLKSHQQMLHVEHVTQIVSSIPTASVLRHLLLHLLKEELVTIDLKTASSTTEASKPSAASQETRRMLEAVFGEASRSVKDAEFASDGLAAAILSLLYCPVEKLETGNDRKMYLTKVCTLFRRLPSMLGGTTNKYVNSLALIKSLLKTQRLFPVKPQGCHDFCRLLFDAVLLLVPLPKSSDDLKACQRKWKRNEPLTKDFDSKTSDRLAKECYQGRRLALHWCLAVYLPACRQELQNEAENQESDTSSNVGNVKKRKRIAEDSKAAVVGAGPPDFSSLLDGEYEMGEVFGGGGNTKPATQHLFRQMVCLLMLCTPESPQLRQFLAPFHLSTEKAASSSYAPPTEQLYQMYVMREVGLSVTTDMLLSIIGMALEPKARSRLLTEFAFNLMECILQPCAAPDSVGGGQAFPSSPAKLYLLGSVQNQADVIWKMYDLAEYLPHQLQGVKQEGAITEQGAHANDRAESEQHAQENTPGPPMARVAYPGLWWRATALSLVICGANSSQSALMANKTETESVSADASSKMSLAQYMWAHHPTLRALMKMSLSGRYRFPTIDCSADKKEAMKYAESQCRDQEAQIAFDLFLPKAKLAQQQSKKLKVAAGTDSQLTAYDRGSTRVSARQRAKQERELQQRLEQEDMEARLEAQRVRKLTKEAQKTITLHNPKGLARKPPRDAVNLILSVNDMFDIPSTFRQSSYFCQMIDFNDRTSIERAYEWLIPIISHAPSIIDELPPGASCLLLLKAYGQRLGSGPGGASGGAPTDAATSGNDALLELSAPLLKHVRTCLKGEMGSEKAQNACVLLTTDLCDASPDRRRCARRVLQESIGDLTLDEFGDRSNNRASALLYQEALTVHFHTTCGWIASLLVLKDASAMIPPTAALLAKGVFSERAAVLRSYMTGLFLYDKFMNLQKGSSIDEVTATSTTWTLCELMATRPHQCSDAMGQDTKSFRPKVIEEICLEVNRLRRLQLASDAGEDNTAAADNATLASPNDRLVCIRILDYAHEEASKQTSDFGDRIGVRMPFSLLRAMVLLLSAWRDDEDDDAAAVGTMIGSSSAEVMTPPKNPQIVALCHDLLGTMDNDEETQKGANSKSARADTPTATGAAGAYFVWTSRSKSQKLALTVEDWTMLAKSRCGFIGRQAALSAPIAFLPRLLLCCGLPQSSFTSMLERLGALGSRTGSSPGIFDDADDDERDRMYKQLLAPSATHSWGLGGQLGSTRNNRSAVARKLLGRIMAYLTLFSTQQHEHDESSPSETETTDSIGISALKNSTFVSWLEEQCDEAAMSAAEMKRPSKKRQLSQPARQQGKLTQFGMLSSAATYIKATVRSVSKIKTVASTGGAHLSLDAEHDHPMEGDRSRLLSFTRGGAAGGSKKRPRSIAGAAPGVDESQSLHDLMPTRDVLLIESHLQQIVARHEDEATELTRQKLRMKRGGWHVETEMPLLEAAQALLAALGADASSPVSSGSDPFKMRALVQRWVPRLTEEGGSEDLWTALFCLTSKKETAAANAAPSYNIHQGKLSDLFLVSLVNQCLNVWSDPHVLSCRAWLMKQLRMNRLQRKQKDALSSSLFPVSPAPRELSLGRAIGFLVATSQRRSFHDTYHQDAIFTSLPLARNALIDNVDQAQLLANSAIRYFLGEEEEIMDLASSGKTPSWLRRNGLPDWLALIIFVAQSNKKHSQMLVKLLADQLGALTKKIEAAQSKINEKGSLSIEADTEKDSTKAPSQVVDAVRQQRELHRQKQKAAALYQMQKNAVESVILRLYCYFPTYVALGDSRVRSALLHAASLYSKEWLTWRCPLDDQARELISNLGKSPMPPQAISCFGDLAKPHPLLVARQFVVMRDILAEDAAVKKFPSDAAALPPMRTVVTPEYGTGSVRFRSRHWGDTFDEKTWMYALDFLSFLPLEVTFSDCSLRAGLLDILQTYVRLIGAQTRPWSMSRGLTQTQRLRSKLTPVLTMFLKHNPKAYSEFAASKLQGAETWGAVAGILTKAQLQLEFPSSNATQPSNAPAPIANK